MEMKVMKRMVGKWMEGGRGGEEDDFDDAGADHHSEWEGVNGENDDDEDKEEEEEDSADDE